MKVDAGAGRERKVQVDYPSNSRKKKEAPPEKETIVKVVTTEVVTRKKSPTSGIFRNFFSEDSGSVVQYVVGEVLLPAFKNMVSDAVSQGIERMLFGDSRPSPAGRRGQTNYARFTQSRHIPGSADPRPEMSRQARATHDFNDIIIASRAEAEDVIDRLRDLINTYEVATVSDLYDLVGLTGEFTDDKWGWYDLRSAAVRAIRGGYLLHLPRTQPIV
jgi:hypothetical protein